jgi:hypothetical protein
MPTPIASDLYLEQLMAGSPAGPGRESAKACQHATDEEERLLGHEAIILILV